MKKIVFVLVILAMAAQSCKKKNGAGPADAIAGTYIGTREDIDDGSFGGVPTVHYDSTVSGQAMVIKKTGAGSFVIDGQDPVFNCNDSNIYYMPNGQYGSNIRVKYYPAGDSIYINIYNAFPGGTMIQSEVTIFRGTKQK